VLTIHLEATVNRIESTSTPRSKSRTSPTPRNAATTVKDAPLEVPLSDIKSQLSTRLNAATARPQSHSQLSTIASSKSEIPSLASVVLLKTFPLASSKSAIPSLASAVPLKTSPFAPQRSRSKRPLAPQSTHPVTVTRDPRSASRKLGPQSILAYHAKIFE